MGVFQTFMMTSGGSTVAPFAFDNYGQYDVDPSAMTLTSVCTVGTSTTMTDGIRMSGLISNGDPASDATILLPLNGGARPYGIYPSGANTWSSASNSSHFTVYGQFANAGGASTYGTLGVRYEADTTSQWCWGKQAHYLGYESAGANVTYGTINQTAKGTWATGSYQMGPTSQRFAHASSSVGNFWASAAKDQLGGSSGWSGQPTMGMFKGDTGTTKTTFAAQSQSQNTHGHLNRIQFISGTYDGYSSTVLYSLPYNQFSGGADGYKNVQVTQSGNGTPSISLGGHKARAINAAGGWYMPTINKKPFTFICEQDTTSYGGFNNAFFNGTSTGINWTSVTGSYEAAACIYTDPATSTMTYLFAKGTNLYMRTLTTAGSWGNETNIGNVSNQVVGINPIPGTTRFVVSMCNGIELFDLS